MTVRTIYVFVVLGLIALIMASLMSAMAATNAVPLTGLAALDMSITADDLKPAACDDQDIDHLIVSTGAISGTAANDLILGGTGIDTISGGGGDDCIVGGGGADLLFGDSGADTCIGGPGIDVLDLSCEVRKQ